MKGLRNLIREIHRRSLWQVLGIYVLGAWVALQVIEVLASTVGLPEWFPALAIALLVIGLPIVLATAVAREGGPSSTRIDPTLMPAAELAARTASQPGGAESDVRRWLTWRHALFGGLGAFAVWGVVAAAWLLMGGVPAGDGGPTAVAVDQDVVAVLPFRVAGADASLGYLREGMVDLLAAKLTGERGPRAADPRTVLSAWRRTASADDSDLPEDAAVGLATALGAGQVLLGGVVGTPAHLVINAAVLDAASGRSMVRASVEGTADSLTTLVDRLAAQLLAGEAGASGQQLSTLTSASLPALRAYLDGQSAYRRGRYVEARTRFEAEVGSRKLDRRPSAGGRWSPRGRPGRRTSPAVSLGGDGMSQLLSQTGR